MIAEILLTALILTAQPAEEPTPRYEWSGPVLTAEMGCNLNGPTGAETWYNMPMDTFIQFLYDLGFEGYHYIREDGVHMWHDDTGDFVMVGAYLPKYPRGTVVQTSLGQGKVFDTGYFLYGEDQLDIATTWYI